MHERRATTPLILSVRGLRMGFASGFARTRTVLAAVDGIDFALRAGETLALLGESGCGKSATALSLLRLLPAAGRITGGSVKLEGTELLTLAGSRDARRARRRHGDDLPGAGDQSQPGAHRRPADRRGAGAPSWGWPARRRQRAPRSC